MDFPQNKLWPEKLPNHAIMFVWTLCKTNTSPLVMNGLWLGILVHLLTYDAKGSLKVVKTTPNLSKNGFHTNKSWPEKHCHFCILQSFLFGYSRQTKVNGWWMGFHWDSSLIYMMLRVGCWLLVAGWQQCKISLFLEIWCHLQSTLSIINQWSIPHSNHSKFMASLLLFELHILLVGKPPFLLRLKFASNLNHDPFLSTLQWTFLHSIHTNMIAWCTSFPDHDYLFGDKLGCIFRRNSE